MLTQACQCVQQVNGGRAAGAGGGVEVLGVAFAEAVAAARCWRGRRALARRGRPQASARRRTSGTAERSWVRAVLAAESASTSRSASAPPPPLRGTRMLRVWALTFKGRLAEAAGVLRVCV